ncbi:hypothetical protein NFI96_014515 [Prochilodus magdalenae]|nr:hypothetical protein NFI96_014515 [Prochilodus magdalenae]
MRDTLCEKNMACSACLRNSEKVATQEGIKSKKNWRSRLRIFLKKPPHTLQARPKRKQYRPTPDEVNQWTQSMDKLLSCKYGTIAFRVFMKSEFCEENIEFWLACEEFRKIKSPTKRRARAKRIYKEFIKIDSPKEINVDISTKNAIFKSLSCATQSSFIAAQNKVYNLMENNCYPRFLESHLYSQLYKLAHGNECASWE